MKNFFSFFSESRNSFEGQGRGEEVFLLIREHWIYFISHIFIFLLEIVLPIIVINVLSSFVDITKIMSLLIFLIFVWIIFAWTRLFYSLMKYTLTTYIVTNERVIINKQVGFWSREVREININRIQNVETKVEGFWDTLLHFGDVTVETAGEKIVIFMDNIPNPKHVHDTLMKLLNKKPPMMGGYVRNSFSPSDQTFEEKE